MNESLRVAIIDDDAAMLQVLEKHLVKAGYEAETFTDPLEATDAVTTGCFPIVITDICMPGLSGLDLLKRIRDNSPYTTVICITAFGSVSSAVEAMHAGAYDYISKPFNLAEFSLVVDKAAERYTLHREVEQLRDQLQQKYSLSNIIGKSPSILRIFETINRVARSQTNVLITGRSGTGKELVARAIHFNGDRAVHPFVAVNCSAIPEDLLESELFGHVRGAFTGATADTTGLFRAAEGGTLFLDEIGDMPFSMQAKLLRVIEDRQVRPVGSAEKVHVDVRVICATNKRLDVAVERGEFREDLLYRINVITISIPDLRERQEDIPLLVEFFLHKYADQMGKSVPDLPRDTMDILLRYPWPGNVRELENVIERSLLMCNGDTIKPGDLPLTIRHYEPALDLQSIENASLSMLELENRYIAHVLKKTGGDFREAADILGVTVDALKAKVMGVQVDGVSLPGLKP
ncbi:MAG: sigma-54-dependent Fis family transcriptional regulator [Chlorobi bacterium]|nr:sigma-54-dependent Fis family transcriptional regulator [Chlorobiota bacterium]